jgi:hypothetical protein
MLGGRPEDVHVDGDTWRDTLSIDVEHTGVDLHITTYISIGGHLILEYDAGTRHLSTAQEAAAKVLADALRPLLAAAAEADGYRRVP